MSFNQYKDLIEQDKLHIRHFVYMNNLSSPVKIKAVELVSMDVSGVMEPETIDANEEFIKSHEKMIVELQTRQEAEKPAQPEIPTPPQPPGSIPPPHKPVAPQHGQFQHAEPLPGMAGQIPTRPLSGWQRFKMGLGMRV